MKGFLLSAVLGFLALALVNLCGEYTGVLLPVNRLNLGAAGLLGIPGVTLMILLDTLL
ncbi:MAG: pro-sigmaK processing inhibitor BofA family protein [Acutalibacter sp.]|jgi:pro-sigmaK processing inhibitor BofA